MAQSASETRVFVVYCQRACSDKWYNPYQDVMAIFECKDGAVTHAKALQAAHTETNPMGPQSLYFVKRHVMGVPDYGVWVYSIDKDGIERYKSTETLL